MPSWAGCCWLGISTVCEPTSATGPNDILRYGAAGHIFLSRVPPS
ncbi:hypothetical protein [Streptomyces sp. DSM 15324]|nr:hypothetical protein [Streptomyces sp. DSM 15324]